MKKFIAPVVLAVLASAIWENIVKPSSSWFLNLLVNITTLGIKGLQNDLYKEMAKGLHEDVSLRVMILLYAFLLSSIFVVVLVYFRLRRQENKENAQEAKGHPIAKTFLRRKIFIISYLIFMFVFFAFDLSRTIYTNQAITYYNQLKTIVLPYITDEQAKVFDSSFAQMGSAEDYKTIMGELEQIAQNNKERVPKSPSLVSVINYPTF